MQSPNSATDGVSKLAFSQRPQTLDDKFITCRRCISCHTDKNRYYTLSEPKGREGIPLIALPQAFSKPNSLQIPLCILLALHQPRQDLWLPNQKAQKEVSEFTQKTALTLLIEVIGYEILHNAQSLYIVIANLEICLPRRARTKALTVEVIPFEHSRHASLDAVLIWKPNLDW